MKILQDLVVKRTLVLPYAVPMEAVVSSLIHERFATAASSLQVRKGHWNWQALGATVKAELRTSTPLLGDFYRLILVPNCKIQIWDFLDFKIL